MERLPSTSSLGAGVGRLLGSGKHGRKLSNMVAGDAWLGGAVRDLTVHFKELRDKARPLASVVPPSSSSSSLSTRSSRDIELRALVAHQGEVDSSSSSSSSATRPDELRLNVPPSWLRLVDESHYDLDRIKAKSTPTLIFFFYLILDYLGRLDLFFYGPGFERIFLIFLTLFL